MTDNIELPPLVNPAHPTHAIGPLWTTDQMQTYAREAVRLNAAPVPDGWKLVPVEPTKEMLDAYVNNDGRFHSARSDYAAMLSAAPEPQGEPESRPCHVFNVTKTGALTEWEPTSMAFALPDGKHALYTLGTAEPQGVPDERAAFEAWASGWFGPGFATRSENGQYNWPSVEDTWEVWQARAVLSAPKPQGVPEPADWRDAYEGAREDLSIWKRRALEAERDLRAEKEISSRLVAEINATNGPTFMGEPTARRAQQSRAAQPEQERRPLSGRPSEANTLVFIADPTSSTGTRGYFVDEIPCPWWWKEGLIFKNASDAEAVALQMRKVALGITKESP